jgi:DNA-directed RNA polymerase subunit RPC12/RpoP
LAKLKINGVKMNGICPNCDEIVQLSNTIKRNDLLDCPICGEPLMVKKLIPLELDYDMSEYEDEDGDNEDD